MSLTYDAGQRSVDLVLLPSKVLSRTLKDLQRRGVMPTTHDETLVVVEVLRQEVEKRAAIEKAEPVQLRYIRELFAEADEDNSGTVSFQLLLLMHILERDIVPFSFCSTWKNYHIFWCMAHGYTSVGCLCRLT